MSVAVVILNYNGRNFLEKFLPAVINTCPAGTVYVADNASTDGSIDLLKKQFPAVNLMVLPQNLGFAEGYNQALKHIESEHCVLLNSDIEVTTGWLEPLISGLRKFDAVQPKVLSYGQKDHFEYAGAAGGMIDALGYPFCRGRVFDSLETDRDQYSEPARIFWATGACMAIKTQIFKELGGFDATFFAHMEEIDLCWRMHHAGYQIGYEPSSTIYHVGGGTLQSTSPFKTLLNFRNSLLTLYKNTPWSELWWKFPVRLLLDGVAGLKMIFEGKFAHTWAIIKGHFSAYYFMISGKTVRTKNMKDLRGMIHGRSIVYQYFIQKKKTYVALTKR